MEFENGLGWIQLFQWMANHGYTLRDYGNTQSLLLSDNPYYEVTRITVQALCDFDYLRREEGRTDGKVFTEFKLTDKANRLLDVLKARESESDTSLNFWIVVVNGIVFIDRGNSPPNLKALIGEKWNYGDRIVITCHDPCHVRVGDLRLALASEVYGGLSYAEIDEIEKIASDRSPS